MKTVKTTEVTITKVRRLKGSNQITYNVDVNGAPFGQIWTFAKTATETYRFHVKTLKGFYSDFATLRAAEEAIRAQI